MSNPTVTMPSAATAVALREARPFPARCGVAEVLRSERVTPRMARVTLGGQPLADLPVELPGEIITLGFAGPGERLVLPREGWQFPDGRRQHWRNYTVRRYDSERGELDVDFALHDAPIGIATRWAVNARPGDHVGIAGPRIDWMPAAADGVEVLVGDETALPAIAAVLESLPASARALALIEVADADARHELSWRADVELHWLERGGAAKGSSALLLDALRSALPDDVAQVWAAGEAGVMRHLRDHLHGQRGLGRERARATGYWRHRRTPEWVPRA